MCAVNAVGKFALKNRATAPRLLGLCGPGPIVLNICMRANEFILTEDENQFDMSNPELTRARYFPDMDKYYELYRLTLDMAGINTPPDQLVNDIDGEGWPASNNALMLAYSQGDDDIINRTLKKRGYKQKMTSPGSSREADKINRSSPVAKIKRNRYGV